jgi:hypothetical protein
MYVTNGVSRSAFVGWYIDLEGLYFVFGELTSLCRSVLKQPCLSVRVGGHLEQLENSEKRGYWVRIQVLLLRIPKFHPHPHLTPPPPKKKNTHTQRNRDGSRWSSIVYFHILSYFLQASVFSDGVLLNGKVLRMWSSSANLRFLLFPFCPAVG